MDTLWQDIKYGARMLAKSPGFTVVAVLSLALGIGVNSAIFSVVNAVLFKPLPVESPEQLAKIFATGQDKFLAEYPLSYPDYEDYRDQSDVFDGLFAYAGTPFALDTGTENQFVLGEVATGNYFTTLGVSGALGRVFQPDDDREGAAPVAVLGHNAWKRRFDSDPAIVGQPILLNGTAFTVIGVAPEEFRGLIKGLAPELWIPIKSLPLLNPRNTRRLERRSGGWLWVAGRLKPSVDLEQARSRLATIAARLAQDHPDSNEDRGVSVYRAGDVVYFPGVDRALRVTAMVLMAVVGLVLLIACANVANMLLARAAARQREVAIRLSLGAGRLRLVRQLLTESLLLSLFAGGIGLLIALWSNGLLSSLQIPFSLEIDIDLGLGLDARVFGFTLGAAFLTAFLFGLAPALQAAGTDLAPALKEEGGRTSGSKSKNRLRNALVVAQVALSLVLLIGAGLSVRSLQNANLIDPGFDAANVISARFEVNLRGMDEAEGQIFYNQLAERVSALPGVQSVAYATHLPLNFEIRLEGVVPDEQRSLPDDEWPNVDMASVGPGYFETLRIPLVAGRSFTEQDREGSPQVAVVNEALAAKFWPGENPLGRKVFFDEDGDGYEVVGVARNGKYRTLGEAPRPYVYKSLLQNYEGSQMLLTRTEGDMRPLLTAIRQEARAIDPKVPVIGLRTAEEAIGVVLLLPQFSAAVFGALGLLGLALASVGIYGVISYSVSQRTHEIGIRMALGAQHDDVLLMVLKHAMLLTGVGIALGLLAAFGLTRFLSGVLYGVQSTDLLTFAGVSALLAAVALLACFVPARRATRVDPMVALRYE